MCDHTKETKYLAGGLSFMMIKYQNHFIHTVYMFCLLKLDKVGNSQYQTWNFFIGFPCFCRFRTALFFYALFS